MLYKKINGEKMDLDKWLADAAKWILPFLGILYLFMTIFDLSFKFGFKFN